MRRTCLPVRPVIRRPAWRSGLSGCLVTSKAVLLASSSHSAWAGLTPEPDRHEEPLSVSISRVHQVHPQLRQRDVGREVNLAATLSEHETLADVLVQT